MSLRSCVALRIAELRPIRELLAGDDYRIFRGVKLGSAA